jgi:hypothetical protein
MAALCKAIRKLSRYCSAAASCTTSTEVLSGDAYAAFEETAVADGTPSVETGRLYRQAILEASGSRPALESFKAFRGREPSLDALLRHQGIVAALAGNPTRSPDFSGTPIGHSTLSRSKKS